MSVARWSPSDALPVEAFYCPYELDLCEALGITPEDYWEFIFSAQETLKERGKEYELVPDIRNEPISVTTLVVNLSSV